MAIYDLPNMNGTGIDEVLVDVAAEVNVFIPAFLFFIFFMVWILGYKKQLENTGIGDAPLWATIAGVVTSITAIFLTTKVGLIDVFTLSITIFITIACAIWLFSSKDKT